MIEPVPQPLLLDPDRETSDDREDMTADQHRGRAQNLDAALHATCAYAQQLWTDVAKARQYLYDSLPPDPRSGDERTGTSPDGPDDETGWQRWQDAYSELTSILAGPHGDSGMGRSEARAAAALRRTAPSAVPTTRNAPPIGVADSVAEPAAEPAVAPAVALEPAAATGPSIARLARPVALGMLVALALRGLRPAKRRDPRS